ncbi:MAG TPA: FAD-dependent oxidoreductase [Acidimicrobiales bacterium]|nr:FAD-dependent oxidoreductase [Acidimicrobiales bacterium]
MIDTDFDVIVVGAGPAGSAAALTAARAGARVALLERGPFPGAKNMFGGVVYGRILDSLIPGWYDEMPVQRWITRRSTMMLAGDRSFTVDFRAGEWGRAPYNGATVYRADFDAWLAQHATDAGATLVCDTVVTGLLTESGRVVGVRTDRSEGELRAPMVIACDGVNTFLAKEAGIAGDTSPGNYTLGVKETLSIPRDVLEARFGVRGIDGVDIEVVGSTGDVPGGGFIYTNLDTVAVGVVLRLPELATVQRRPEDILAEFKAHDAVATLVEGGEITEFSAHLIPEGGRDAMGELGCDGMLVAGDAAALCLAAGIWLEGVNFAIGSGAVAGRVAARAARSNTPGTALGEYRGELEANFVLADHTKLRGAPHLILGERMQQRYPEIMCDIAQGMFTVDNPTPKPGLSKIARKALRRHKVRFRDLARDGREIWRSFG